MGEQENSQNRRIERPDLDALRQAYHAPSRWQLYWERLKGVLSSRTFWTVVLALAIVAALLFGFFQLT